ncbi:MAG: tRNA (adenosine(37)-N6)-threonylcarbamoyltransferase complex ATPase subunit type 1 TsaE [Bacteroidia bacterium]|nr:tRNA (adenosine(37)-N6)-threonylcarbamoyltransferase complex ATPase subunit type 1 TsaE [Bacteroidia bacterium]
MRDFPVYERQFSEEELPTVVSELREWAPSVTRWLLVGPLGAGKTRLVQTWLGEEVSSPTFTYIHVYTQAVHVDLYRFPSELPSRWEEVYSLLESAPLVFIEWADKLPFPPAGPAVWVTLTPLSENVRRLRAVFTP